MKIITLLLIFSFIFGCSSNGEVTTEETFSFDDIKKIGFKYSGDFNTEFQDSIQASFGFYKGREIAFLLYPSVEIANTSGLKDAKDQTEKIENTEKNIHHGPNVEKYKCRGGKFSPGPVKKLKPFYDNKLGLNGILLINNYLIFSEKNYGELGRFGPCVRREPLYTNFKIFGNLAILTEPLPTEDDTDTNNFLEQIASSLLNY